MRIVLMQGGVETLDFFSRRLGESFQSMGHTVFYHDLREGASSAKHLKKFQKSGETVLFTFNFEGLEREEGLFSLREGYLWQQYRIPCFNYCVDHPYWYENRFAHLLEDEEHHPGTLALYHHLSVDRNHERYLKEFYPEFRSAGFLPLAGTAVGTEGCVDTGAFPDRPSETASASTVFADRKIKILFTGHYTELPFFEESIHAVNEEYAAFYQGIIDELIAEPDKTVEEVALAHVRRETGSESVRELRLVLYKMLFVDLYVRNFFRGKAVQTLCDAGFPVTVIGKGWEKLPLKKKENLLLRPRTDSAGCLRALRESRLSLNVLPWFKDGAHDRVWNSILNGAVCLTDSSVYLREVLPDGAGVRYFSLKEMESELPACAEKLLSDPALCEEMLLRGMPAARQRHTWKQRAETLLPMLEEGIKCQS